MQNSFLSPVGLADRQQGRARGDCERTIVLEGIEYVGSTGGCTLLCIWPCPSLRLRVNKAQPCGLAFSGGSLQLAGGTPKTFVQTTSFISVSSVWCIAAGSSIGLASCATRTRPVLQRTWSSLGVAGRRVGFAGGRRSREVVERHAASRTFALVLQRLERRMLTMSGTYIFVSLCDGSQWCPRSLLDGLMTPGTPGGGGQNCLHLRAPDFDAVVCWQLDWRPVVVGCI